MPPMVMAPMSAEEAKALLSGIEDGHIKVRDTVPFVDRNVALNVARALDNGWISTARMARALDACFEEIDETFAFHDLPFRTGFTTIT